jgi:WD40 repeat protein
VLSDAVQLSQSRTIALFGRQPPPQRAVYSLAFSPDGKKLAWGSNDNTLAIWDMEKQEVEKRLQGRAQAFITPTVTYSPDGSFLAWSGNTGAVTVWSTASYKMLSSLHQIITPISSLAFSPDGAMLAAGTVNGQTVLWNMTDRSVTRHLVGREGNIFSIAWSQDGRLAAGSGGSVRIWNPKTGETIAKLGGLQMGAIVSVVWSPDGKWLASGSYDGTIVIWDTATGQPIGAPLRHSEGAILSLAISQDGYLLTSGSSDHSFTLWDTSSLTNVRSIATVTDRSAAVSSLAFSPVDMLLAAGDYDGYVYVYRITVAQLPDQPLLQAACSLAKRNLTQAEWQFYFPSKDYRKTCEQWPKGQ